jgi:site-specific recombinase XerD
MRRWDSLVDRYLEGYAAAGRAAGTIANVRRELNLFGLWVKQRRPRPALDDVSSELIVKYIQVRSAFHTKSTVSSVMSKLRGMGEFLVHEGVWASNPLRWLQGPKLDARHKLPKRISREAMTEIWETAARERTGYSRWRWLALLGVLYGSGARLGELIRLNVCDWNAEQGLLQFDGRKTARERQVPVPALTQQCLEAYLPQRANVLQALGLASETALFVTRDGVRVKKGALCEGLKRLVTAAGHPWVTMHKFRHTCASDLLESGAGLCEVQRVLGHQQISSTVRYLHIADPQLHEAVGQHPISEILKGGS